MHRQDTPDLGDGFTAEERAALGDLEPLTAGLARYHAPAPDAADQAALISRLRPLVEARRTEEIDWGHATSDGIGHWLALARAQTALFEPPFWWASGVIFALGLLAGLIGYQGLLALGLLLIAPVLAAFAVAYAFRPAGRTIWELEQISPISPLELLYARLALVLAYNLVFSLALLGVVWVQEPRLVLWRLVLVWLGPMLGLSGAALYAAVRWGTLGGVATPAALWSGFLFFVESRVSQMDFAQPVSTTDLILAWIRYADGAPVLAVAVLVAGIILLHQGGRLASREVVEWS